MVSTAQHLKAALVPEALLPAGTLPSGLSACRAAHGRSILLVP